MFYSIEDIYSIVNASDPLCQHDGSYTLLYAHFH
jgi:hypothetical protein